MGSTSTATSTSTTAVNVKAQVDVHRTLAYLRQDPNPLMDTLLIDPRCTGAVPRRSERWYAQSSPVQARRRARE